MRRLALALIVVLLIPTAVHAYTCNSAGCSFEADYTEPATLTNGQPLTDLTTTTISYTVSTDGGAPGAAKVVSVPASKPAGGGVIAKTITDAALTPGHTYTISATVTATSTAFGTSASSPSASLLMNNGVSPNPTAAPVLK